MTQATDFILGTWFIGNLGFVADEDGILVMLPEGRAVQFPTSITPPKMNQTLRLWYSCLDAHSIRFKMKPDEDGWLRFVERTSSGWIMICDDRDERHQFPCRLARTEELPDWHIEMMEKNLKKMAALEEE